MFIKTGRVGDFTYMITGNNALDVIVEITSNSKVIDSIDHVSLKEAVRYINEFNIKKNDHE
jgi:hypothetical protein